MATNIDVRSLSRAPLDINGTTLSFTSSATVDLDVGAVRRDLHRFLGQWVVTAAGAGNASGATAGVDPQTLDAQTGATVATASAAAGGTGATAGGYDTTAHRDTALQLLDGLKTDYDLTITDVAALYTAVLELQTIVGNLNTLLVANGWLT